MRMVSTADIRRKNDPAEFCLMRVTISVVRFTLDNEITSFGAKAKCDIKPETTCKNYNPLVI
ncbi:TPA: hypothetical protein DHW51_21665 [Candidatus Poribacteria bacterium]|nr:hypothetical protein [Candidatus Poribacteria bacterium]